MDVAKILADLKTSFDKAKEKFDSQDSVIVGIRATLEELEKSIISIQAEKGRGAVTNELGFSTSTEGKKFMDFAKAIFLKDPSAKQMTEGVDSDGGYLVPQEFRPTLIRMIEIFGVIRQNCTVIPMSRLEMAMPRLVSGISTYWVDETAPITPSKPVFGQLKLVAKKLAALVPVSGELMEDSTLAVANLLAILFAEAIAKEEDRVGFMGDKLLGDVFDGISGDVDVNKVVMGAGEIAYTQVTADHLADLIAATPTAALAGSGYFLNPTVFNIIRKLKDQDDNYIYAAPAGAQPGSIWGYPYKMTDSLPAVTSTAPDSPFIIFGNLRNLYLGDRAQMAIALSTHVGFANDLTYLRVIERIAIACGLPAAFAVLKTAEEASS